MSSGKKKELEVFGATILGFAQVCINLNIVAGPKTNVIIKNIKVNKWYPFEILQDLERIVIETYKNVEPILERVGMEMMQIWYSFGPGKQIIDRGVDFLRFQSGSQEYASVVKGPEVLRNWLLKSLK